MIRCRGKWFHRFVTTGEWQRFICSKCGVLAYWNGNKYVIKETEEKDPFDANPGRPYPEQRLIEEGY